MEKGAELVNWPSAYNNPPGIMQSWMASTLTRSRAPTMIVLGNINQNKAK